MASPCPLNLKIERAQHIGPKAHHVVPPPSTASSSSGVKTVPEPSDTALVFKNPWPSWHKPTTAQIWKQLQWGQDEPDPCVELAISHLSDTSVSAHPPNLEHRPNFADVTDWPDSIGAKAARLLRIEKPNFDSAVGNNANVTWLGHAGVLVQLPPLQHGSGPVGCLFDPIFSMRCSPSQMAGPTRTYPPPCNVDELPRIDAVFISHNHYDHLDYDSIMALWKKDGDHIRFFVPLNNRQWFVDCGIQEDRIVELDWWDAAELRHSEEESVLKVWCIPAQHSSGRTGFDANAAAWSSWFLAYQRPGQESYRVFFAGDTGYQFHDSPKWPSSPAQQEVDDDASENQFPACPAFSEIGDRLGPPNLLLLPVSVGATFSYFRSLVPFSNWISLFPRHSPGLTAATHMPAWDAVRVLKLMTKGRGDLRHQGGAVAIAMHWGTFVPEPVEVLRTLGQLEWACQKHGVVFARQLPTSGGDAGKVWFIAPNHGQSVSL